MFTPGIRICATPQKKSCNFEVPLFEMPGAVVCPDCSIGDSDLQKDPSNLDVPSLRRRPIQWSLVRVVPRIRLCTVLQKGPSNVEVPFT
jgi:hypothetical protein